MRRGFTRRCIIAAIAIGVVALSLEGCDSEDATRNPNSSSTASSTAASTTTSSKRVADSTTTTSAAPIATTTTPTNPAGSPVLEFLSGALDTVGKKDVEACLAGSIVSVQDIRKALADIHRGDKSDGLKRLSDASAALEAAAAECRSVDADRLHLKHIAAILRDRRFYTMHTGATLVFNTLEDRKSLGAIEAALDNKSFHEAGAITSETVLDIIGHPGFGNGTNASNSSAAKAFFEGMLSAFSVDVRVNCSTEAALELSTLKEAIAALAGGSIDRGIGDLMKALDGFQPMLQDCAVGSKQAMALLRRALDLATHPSKLMKVVEEDLKENSAAISILAASAELSFKGKQWNRLGLQVGKLLVMLFDVNTTSSAPDSNLASSAPVVPKAAIVV